MGIRVTTKNLNLSRITFSDPALMREIGNLATEDIVERTRGGRDKGGMSFRAYSPGYAAYKQKVGGSSSPVNLTSPKAGVHMLDTIGPTEVSAKTVTIAFTDALKAQIAAYHLGDGRVLRDFWGVSQAFLDRAVQAITARWTF